MQKTRAFYVHLYKIGERYAYSRNSYLRELRRKSWIYFLRYHVPSQKYPQKDIGLNNFLTGKLQCVQVCFNGARFCCTEDREKERDTYQNNEDYRIEDEQYRNNGDI